MGALGLLALFIRANFSLICNTPRDGVFPDRVKIKITISYMSIARRNTSIALEIPILASSSTNETGHFNQVAGDRANDVSP